MIHEKQINRVADEPFRQAILDEMIQASSVRVVDGIVHVESLRGSATVVASNNTVVIAYRGKASDVVYQFWMDKEHASVRALGEQLRRLRHQVAQEVAC
jgi:hypothetical protein